MDQPVYAVTLAALREHRACYNGYNKVVRMLQGEPFSDADADRNSYIKYAYDAPVPLVAIAKSNGIDDALWTLRCIQSHERDARLFAVWCARRVEHLLADQRSKTALDVAERFANGDAKEEELDAAWVDARAAWVDADADAARAATRAARAAAARAAARGAATWTSIAAAADAAAADTADAADATWAAAADAARAAQLEMFIAMCEGRAPWQV
jgi:hypothetical protein